MKGKGRAELYVWWFDGEGKAHYKYIGRYFLPGEYKVLHKVFELPEAAREFRIGFKPCEGYKELSTLYLDNITLEIKVSLPDLISGPLE